MSIVYGLLGGAGFGFLLGWVVGGFVHYRPILQLSWGLYLSNYKKGLALQRVQQRCGSKGLEG